MSYASFKDSLQNFWRPRSTPRILLFFPAILFKLISSILSGTAYVLHNGPLAIIGMLFWILWIVTLFLVALPQTDRWLARFSRRLKPLSLALIGLFIVAGILEFAIAGAAHTDAKLPDFIGPNTAQLLQEQRINTTYNDATALCHQAVDNLLDGKNPYAHANIVSANMRFNAESKPWSKFTPIRTGQFADAFPYPTEAELQSVWQAAVDSEQPSPEMESKLNYPSGCFLLAAPFVWAGIGDLRWVYILAMLAGLALGVLLAPKNMRIWLAAAGLASLEIWQSIASGESGVLVFPFLLLAWLLWRRKLWLSALCMGVAIATKQLVWFLLLFYLIMIWQQLGWKAAISALGITTGVFAAFNGVFIAQNPGLWSSSILAPVTENFFPLGVGPASLVVSGYVNIQSPLPFTIMAITALIIALVWYWRNCRHYPHTGIILAVIPLFFAWRSSWWYFFYFDLILLAIVLVQDYANKPQAEVAQSFPSHI